MKANTRKANQNTGSSDCTIGGPKTGPDHPPRNKMEARQATVTMLAYSAIKNMANFIELVAGYHTEDSSMKFAMFFMAGNRYHVGVLGHKEHGELHRTVLGMVSGDQFGLRLRQIEWDTVGLRVGRHDVNKEGYKLSPEQIPFRNEAQPCSRLRVDDVSQAEAAGIDEHADQRQAESNFVAHHLGRGAQAAEHGILAVRGPSRQGYSIHADRGDAQNDQQPNVDIGDLQRRVNAAQPDPRTNRNDRDRGQRRGQGDDRSQHVQRLIGKRRCDVFLKDKL